MIQMDFSKCYGVYETNISVLQNWLLGELLGFKKYLPAGAK